MSQRPSSSRELSTSGAQDQLLFGRAPAQEDDLMDTSATWVCRTCNANVATAYCATCGEGQLRATDLTLRHLGVQIYRSLSDLDGKLLRTVRNLLVRPGFLTTAYLVGPRKPFLGAFQLFLIVNVIFFAVQSWAPIKIFSTPLASHLQGQDWSEFARGFVESRLVIHGMTANAYAPLFDQAAAVNAKGLVILMALPLALLSILMFSRKGRPFVTHLVFALHFYAFELLVLCTLLIISMLDTWLGGPNVNSGAIDVALFGMQLVAAGIYLYVAVREVYGARGIARILQVSALVVAVGAAILAYRFAIFLITVMTTLR
jgi:Protein of unknown function (DUF3667)